MESMENQPYFIMIDTIIMGQFESVNALKSWNHSHSNSQNCRSNLLRHLQCNSGHLKQCTQLMQLAQQQKTMQLKFKIKCVSIFLDRKDLGKYMKAVWQWMKEAMLLVQNRQETNAATQCNIYQMPESTHYPPPQTSLLCISQCSIAKLSSDHPFQKTTFESDI